MMMAVASIVLFVGFVTPVPAAEYYVDWAGGGDFTAIWPAVWAAADGDIIYITGGTYTGTDNRNIYLQYKNLKFIGGASLPGAARSANPTIIDCEGEARAFYMYEYGIDSTTWVQSLTIRNGVNRDPSGGGGAIYCDRASPTIQYCTFENCDGVHGGAIKLQQSDAFIQYCWFRNNTADYGGALSSSYGSPYLDMVHIWGNSASVSGGGIRIYNGEPRFSRVDLILNSSPEGSAACRLDGVHPALDPTIENCIIAFSTSGGAVGGGDGGTIEHCITYGNAEGNDLPSYASTENVIGDPLYCDLYAYDTGVCEDSPAEPAGNPWGEYIGYTYLGCYAPCGSPVEGASWGAIKGRYR